MLGIVNKVMGMESPKKGKSLKRQLVITFLVIGLVPMLSVGLTAVWLSDVSSTKRVGQILGASKFNKVVAIEEYGKTIVNQVTAAATDPNLANNMKQMIRGFDRVVEMQSSFKNIPVNEEVSRLRQELARYYDNQFLPEYRKKNGGESVDTRSLLNALSNEAVVLQHAYIERNPAPSGSKHEMYKSQLDTTYDTSHSLMHGTFKSFLENFGYYDIFVVDKQGRVIYSVYKELDYATNLLSGPYANSGLGKAFKQSLRLNSSSENTMVDFEQYVPSYSAPASFVAAPIFDGDERLGALIFQIPLDAITAVMSERGGMGQTGESYLVGQDHLLRSDSHKYPEKYSVDTSFRQKLEVKADGIQLALQGKEGIFVGDNYNGEEVISSYAPVDFGDLNWAILVEEETAEAYGPVQKLKLIILGLCLLAAALIGYIALTVSNSIVKPVIKMCDAMARIVKEGDFGERVTVERGDEIGQSAHSLNSMLDSVETSIAETNRVVKSMADGDFRQRIEANVKGDLLTLKEGVNASAESIESAISEVNHVVNSLAHGDFNQRIDLDLKGDLKSLKDGVNTSADAIARAMNDLGQLMDAMSKGDFKSRVEAELVGEYARFAGRADRAMTAVDGALSEIDSVMSQVAQGGLNARVTSDLPGQLNVIKNNLNASLSAVGDVFSETENVLSALAEGHLHTRIETDFPGRFNTLKVNTNATVDKLTEVVYEIQQSSDSVRTSAEDIAQGNSNLSQRTEQQAANLEQTAASMDEITATVQHTATNANRANTLANEARDQASKGGEVVNEAVNAMGEINNASNKIAEIISVIDEIAFQTNLLALNASVEAARAGEQGRGFAVVASEVRNLAGRSATAAKEIKELIEDSVQKVQAGSQLVSKSGQTLEEIISHVENVTKIVGEITTAADEQSIGISEVHKAVESLQLLTQQNTAMVEEAAAASEELGGQARGLSELMRFFSTKGGPTSATVNTASAPSASARPSPKKSMQVNSAPTQSFENDDWEEF